MKSIAAMILQLDGLAESDVTPWEYQFICSIVRQFRQAKEGTAVFSSK